MKKEFLLVLLMMSVCGCDFFEEKANSNSDVAIVASSMINDLSGFSYTVTTTMETGIFDVETTMVCNEDRINETAYCETSAYGTNEYVYYDYANGMMYQNYSTVMGSSDDWTTYKMNFTNNSNSFLNLNDYIFDLEKSETTTGILYTGVIDSKKLAEATSEVESDIDVSDIISSDIYITILINELGYIETMNYEIEVMGMLTKTSIEFSNYNGVGSIVISEEVN